MSHLPYFSEKMGEKFENLFSPDSDLLCETPVALLVNLTGSYCTINQSINLLEI